MSEWICPECGAEGSYYEIRRFFDYGVDLCPECRSEVKDITEEHE